MPLTLSGLSGCPLGHQQLVGIEPVHLYFCVCQNASRIQP
jgi:hypothetical protein